MSPDTYFGALHQALQGQYQPCSCEACTKTRLELKELPKKKTPFKHVLNTAEKAFKRLFQDKKYQPKNIFKTPEYHNLIQATTDIFTSAIPHTVSDTLRDYLEQDVFVFSALKTHTQLTQARSFLKTQNGEITPYHEFKQKILKLNKAYNQNYLQAEYEFAVQSAQSADSWENFSDDTKRYSLQYRTAGDSHVRASHRPLNDTTLPKDDPFWDNNMPPLGWRCRCVAIEVLARDQNKSNPETATKKGAVATTQIGKSGKNKLAMFRFNPGKHKKLFPPQNSYTKVVGADMVSKNARLKIELKQQRADIKSWAKDNLVGKIITHPDIEQGIGFSVSGIKEALNQPHKHIIAKNKAVKNIETLVKSSKYIRTDRDIKGRDIKYHYLKTQIENEDAFIVIRHYKDEELSYFYSITDKIKSR